MNLLIYLVVIVGFYIICHEPKSKKKKQRYPDMKVVKYTKQKQPFYTPYERSAN